MSDSLFNDKTRLINGYYEDLMTLRKEVPPEDFYFLEDVFEGTDLSAYDFLHGFCFTFAIELSKTFGYEIETVKDEDLDLIHAYCVAQTNGDKVYIDIRGITNDPELFFDDFDDMVPIVKGEISKSYLDTGWLTLDVYPDADQYLRSRPGFIQSRSYGKSVADARSFIEANRDIYDVKLLQNKQLKHPLDNIICDARSRHDAVVVSHSNKLHAAQKNTGKGL